MNTRVVWRRGVAHVIDNALPVALALAIAAAVNDEGGLFFVLWVGIHLFQWLILQGLTGWTVGKWLLGIRVVDAGGQPPGVLAAVKRTLPLLFEWTTLIALIAMYRDPYARRIGDRWAGTYVVRAPRRGELATQSSEVTA